MGDEPLQGRPCRRPGCTALTTRIPGAVKQPLYCELHRPAPRSRDADAERARKASRKRSTEELREREEAQRPLLDLIKIAAVLPFTPDPVEACALVGLKCGVEEAEDYVQRARARYKELIDGNPQALDQIIRAGIIGFATTGLQPEAVAPSQRAGAASLLAKTRESLGLTSQPRFAKIELTVLGPDGAVPIKIGPTNKGE